MQEKSVQEYVSARNEFYRPYIAAQPHVLENLLLSQVYSSPFPYTDARAPLDDFLLLVTRYAMVKLLAVGTAAFERRLGDDLVVQGVQSLLREIDASPGYLAHVLSLLKRRNLASLEFMAILLVS